VKLRELFEVKAGNIGKRYQQATRGLNTFGDGERASGDYTQYRLSLALACSDGVTPPDIDPKSWHGKRKTAHPYTEEEQAMLIQGYKVVGASYKDLNKGDMRSQELDTTYVVSPVANPKRNKYGI
jgi:hypothetical protein